jgi:hypothetical protein
LFGVTSPIDASYVEQSAKRTKLARLSSTAITIDFEEVQTTKTAIKRFATRKALESRRCIKCATSRVSRV